MYLFELITKYIKGKKYKKALDFDPFETGEQDAEFDSENCEHVFLPIDSTEETLACSKCGLVVKREYFQKKLKFDWIIFRNFPTVVLN